MRAVLGLGLCLLLVAALLRLAGPETRRTHSEQAGPDGGLSVLAASKGALLPAAAFAGGEHTLDDGILIGDLILKAPNRPPGLRVAALAPGLEFRAHRIFDVAAEERKARAFLHFTGDHAVGSVLVLTTYGDVRPAAGPLGARLAARLAELGAEEDPLASAPCSWAMITARRPDGWVKLAETFSRERGVTLAFTLNADLSLYDGHRGEVLREQLEGGAAVALDGELSSAVTTELVRRTAGAVVGRERRSAIEAPPPGGPSSVLWRNVPIRDGTVFRAGIGLRKGSWAESSGATFSLLVDGETLRVEALRRDPAPPSDWRDWEVDLHAYAGRTVELELRVDPDGDPRGDVALWGSPTIVYAPGS